MTLQEILVDLKSKKIEISFGSNGGLSGQLLEIGEGVIAVLTENDRKIYIPTDKIVTVNEIAGAQSRPGFVP